MEIGIDSFAGNPYRGEEDTPENRAKALDQLLERIVFADVMGLHMFGIGEHYRQDFLDSAQAVVMTAALARTQHIRLSSAVTVLSASDPVRIFQNFATMDLISKGRVEMVAGRGSFTDAFPLFGLDLADYDDLFTEKLDLILRLRDEEVITWSGRFRPALKDQPIYPRPYQERMPIWLGVGGTPGSFVRAGNLGLPLMVAVIGGETRRFRPFVDMYREAYLRAGHPEDQMKVGLHSLGYVSDDREKAVEAYYPGYAEMFNEIGKERGWPPVTRASFNAQNGPMGALLIDGPEAVADKIERHSEALGGIDRFTFQMDNAGLSHEQLMHSIELIGQEIVPRFHRVTA